MTITSNTVSSGSSTNTGAVILIYTSNEATTNFVVTDITVTECVTSAFTTTSSTVYGSTCTEDTNAKVPTVKVAASTFTDALSNANSVSNTYTWTYDTTAPTMTITATNGESDGDDTNTAAFPLTFTSSEATANFAASDITSTGGDGCTIGAFSSSSTSVYTATCTPDNAGETVNVVVAATTYTDTCLLYTSPSPRD